MFGQLCHTANECKKKRVYTQFRVSSLYYSVMLFTDIDKPYIDGIEIGENFVVVSWNPSTYPPSNPASEFVVEYRPEGIDR